MADVVLEVFRVDRGRTALEKYAAANHLTVQVFDADARPVGTAVNRTALADLFAAGRGPGLFDACAERCVGQSEPGVPFVLMEQYGVAVVGARLLLADTVVGAVVAGYALTAHPRHREITRLARDCGLSFGDVWTAARKELPVPTAWLLLRGELLGILANTLLSEDRRARELEETSLQLAEAAEAKDRFLAVLSHELRTPLTAILGYAAIVRHGKLDEAGVRRALEVIERNARLQTQMIGDLLDVSRIVSGSVRLDLLPLTLGPVIEAAAANAGPTAHARDVRLLLVLDAAAPAVSGDASRLQQVASNLISNAIKFTPAGGTVEVRLERTEQGADIVVRDTGAGIPADFLPYVFDRFRQADTTAARAHGGLGLGLAIVRHLVGLHGGTVRAESAGEGQGATFTVSLPALVGADVPAVLETRPTAPIADALDACPTLAGLHVLVVDDDPDARSLFTNVLVQHDARVTAVASAGAALVALEDFKPDVLVSDIAMPGDSGYVLMRTIRRLPSERGGTIPALAVTAYAGPDDVALALSSGFQAHVAKPVQPADLALAVGELTRGIR